MADLTHLSRQPSLPNHILLPTTIPCPPLLIHRRIRNNPITNSKCARNIGTQGDNRPSTRCAENERVVELDVCFTTNLGIEWLERNGMVLGNIAASVWATKIGVSGRVGSRFSWLPTSIRISSSFSVGIGASFICRSPFGSSDQAARLWKFVDMIVFPLFYFHDTGR